MSDIPPGKPGFRADAAPTFMRALRAFVEHNVDFVVCGGVACLLQGGERATEDVDLCVRLDTENLTRVIAAAHALDMQPRIPEPIDALLNEKKRRDWIEQKQAMVYTLVARKEGVQIDIFLHYPIPFDELERRSNRILADDLPLRVSSKQDLIEAKRQVQPTRVRDVRDIEDMQRLIQREQQPPTT